jgi:hypothetical protein
MSRGECRLVSGYLKADCTEFGLSGYRLPSVWICGLRFTSPTLQKIKDFKDLTADKRGILKVHLIIMSISIITDPNNTKIDMNFANEA